MNLLNHFSIKTRMLALVLLPLIFASFLSGLEIIKQKNNVQALNTLNSKIDFLQSFSQLNNSINQARETLFRDNAYTETSPYSKSLTSLETLLPKAFS